HVNTVVEGAANSVRSLSPARRLGSQGTDSGPASPGPRGKRFNRGVRLMWDLGKQLGVLDKWNPWSKQIPFMTFQSHPLHWIKLDAAFYEVENFGTKLSQVVQQHRALNMSLDGSACSIVQEPILIEAYVGLSSVIHNANQLGFYKCRVIIQVFVVFDGLLSSIVAKSETSVCLVAPPPKNTPQTPSTSGGVQNPNLNLDNDPSGRMVSEEKLLCAGTIFCLFLVGVLMIMLALYPAWSRHADDRKGCDVHQNYWDILNKINREGNNKDTLCLTPECVSIAANVLQSLDTSVSPCDDFYHYACGGWLKRNPLPFQKEDWSKFREVLRQNEVVLKNALESPTKELVSTAEMKAQMYYHSCLDPNNVIEDRGHLPMQQLITSLGGWNISGLSFNPKTWDFQRTIENVHNYYNLMSLFHWEVGEDEKHPSKHIIKVDQLELPFPREYYMNSTEDHGHVLDALHRYMTTDAMLMGGKEAEAMKQMKDVLDFELQLAEITIPKDKRRDDEKEYHKMTIEELQTMAPFLNWTRYFNVAFVRFKVHPLTERDQVVVYAPEYLKALSTLLQQFLSTDDGKILMANYLMWHALRGMEPAMPEAFREAGRTMNSAVFGGTGVQERWRDCVSETIGAMGYATGSMFVRHSFPPNAKVAVQQMIDDIRGAFITNLDKLNWMDSETRKLARKKAEKITDMIGYPDLVLDPNALNERYRYVKVVQENYFQNNIELMQQFLREHLENFEKPVDKTKWAMPPSTVNAYYTPTKNQMVIPAGILQDPFYSIHRPITLNYGGIGIVLGHELTHAFDDQGEGQTFTAKFLELDNYNPALRSFAFLFIPGREYDENGELNQWWRNSTIRQFQKMAQCFVNQYSNYEISPRNHLNGILTLGKETMPFSVISLAWIMYLKRIYGTAKRDDEGLSFAFCAAGENLADNGGLRAAYNAWKKRAKETEGEDIRLPGINLTDGQLFFVGFAQVWCTASTPLTMHYQVLGDPHSPGQFRVNGPVSNSIEFAKEFNCPDNSRMNPSHKCLLW
ncbi:unnamed protein product, partial [Cyprideis torosa]